MPSANTGSGTAVTGSTTPASGLISRSDGHRRETPRPSGGQRSESSSAARLSASGPTITWTMRPERTTPNAPLAFSALSSTRWASVDLDAEPGDARLQVHDVRVPTQRCEDLLCLAHGTPRTRGRASAYAHVAKSSPVGRPDTARTGLSGLACGDVEGPRLR